MSVGYVLTNYIHLSVKLQYPTIINKLMISHSASCKNGIVDIL